MTQQEKQVAIWKESLDNTPIKSFDDTIPSAGIRNLSRLQISTVNKTNENEVNGIIYLLINDLAYSFNLGVPMTAVQLKSTASEVKELYPHYSLRDLKLFVKQASRGDYGRPPHSVDKSMILEWLKMFDRERLKHIEEKVERYEQTDVIKLLMQNEGIKNLIDTFELKPEPIEYKPDLNPETLRQKELIKEFDKLWMEQVMSGRIEDKGIRAIEYKGKMVDVTDYLIVRLKETGN